jgi:hypothetical protein
MGEGRGEGEYQRGELERESSPFPSLLAERACPEPVEGE